MILCNLVPSLLELDFSPTPNNLLPLQGGKRPTSSAAVRSSSSSGGGPQNVHSTTPPRFGSPQHAAVRRYSSPLLSQRQMRTIHEKQKTAPAKAEATKPPVNKGLRRSTVAAQQAQAKRRSSSTSAKNSQGTHVRAPLASQRVNAPTVIKRRPSDTRRPSGPAPAETKPVASPAHSPAKHRSHSFPGKATFTALPPETSPCTNIHLRFEHFCSQQKSPAKSALEVQSPEHNSAASTSVNSSIRLTPRRLEMDRESTRTRTPVVAVTIPTPTPVSFESDPPSSRDSVSAHFASRPNTFTPSPAPPSLWTPPAAPTLITTPRPSEVSGVSGGDHQLLAQWSQNVAYDLVATTVALENLCLLVEQGQALEPVVGAVTGCGLLEDVLVPPEVLAACEVHGVHGSDPMDARFDAAAFERLSIAHRLWALLRLSWACKAALRRLVRLQPAAVALYAFRVRADVLEPVRRLAPYLPSAPFMGSSK
eukprot:TRINITY_DN3454_c0_g2_i2.p1 TRINITY_DN3454_c0_g2~~TRINITY_DN3454_c0_g2_i2.p1  ORF type:complete len:478 (+),score=49.56 TRINITY_DN3454_c0_g2_i2:257-1690(+)